MIEAEKSVLQAKSLKLHRKSKERDWQDGHSSSQKEENKDGKGQEND